MRRERERERKRDEKLETVTPSMSPLPRCNILQCLAGDKVFEVYARSHTTDAQRKREREGGGERGEALWF